MSGMAQRQGAPPVVEPRQAQDLQSVSEKRGKHESFRVDDRRNTIKTRAVNVPPAKPQPTKTANNTGRVVCGEKMLQELDALQRRHRNAWNHFLEVNKREYARYRPSAFAAESAEKAALFGFEPPPAEPKPNALVASKAFTAFSKSPEGSAINGQWVATSGLLRSSGTTVGSDGSPVVRRLIEKHYNKAWVAFFEAVEQKRNAGPPRFRAWDGQALPMTWDSPTARPFRVERVGKRRLRVWLSGLSKPLKVMCSDNHLDGTPKQITLHERKRRKCRVDGKESIKREWGITISFEVPDVPNTAPLAAGVDVNASTSSTVAVAYSDGTCESFKLLDGNRGRELRRLERKKKRYQRRMARMHGPAGRSVKRRKRPCGGAQRKRQREARLAGKVVGAKRGKPSNRWLETKEVVARTSAKAAAVRKDWRHKVTSAIAEKAGVVYVEDLRVGAMTRSAKEPPTSRAAT